MHESERASERILARFRATERPPPPVDDLVLTRLQHELQAIVAARVQRRRTLKRATLVGFVVVFAFFLVILSSPQFFVRSREDRTATASSLHHDSGPSVGGTKSSRPFRSEHRDAPHEDMPAPSPSVPPSLAPKDPGFALLKRARELIKSGKHQEAIGILRGCKAAVGSDDLGEECDMLEIESHCGAGQKSAGLAKLAAFQKAWPHSKYEQRVEDACR